jgi:hypothetical protein
MARTDVTLSLLPAARVALRVVGIVVGAYAASAALVAAGVALLIVAGVDKRDAFTVCSILGFAVYVAFALWAAAVQRLSVLFGTIGLIMATGAALGILPALLGGA